MGRRLSCAFAVILGFQTSGSAAASFSLLAELPDSGMAGNLSIQRLGPGGAPFVVDASSAGIKSWRVGAVAPPVLSTGGSRAAFADFDADGLLDVALVRVPDGGSGFRLVLQRGDGAGGFVELKVIPLDRQIHAVAAGDVDGDGLPDLVLGTSELPFGDAPALETWLGRGAFQFAAPRVTGVGPALSNIGTVSAADLTGDQRADVVVSSATKGPVAVFRSTGDGTFTRTAPLAGYQPSAPFFEDLDQDGRPDLVYVNDIQSTRYLLGYRNEGDGQFTLADSATAVGPYSGPMAIADLDEDGALDLAIPYLEPKRSPVLEVFPGDRRGHFAAPRRWSLPADTRRGALLVLDWNEDGRPDLLLQGPHGLVVLHDDAPRVDVQTVPVLVSTTGLNGSRFDSDLLLTNAGTTAARVTLSYTAAQGGGSGRVVRDLGAGQQLYTPSAFALLRDEGLAIPHGEPLVGTMRISSEGASSRKAVLASVRTTSPGGAGVAYSGTSRLEALWGDAVVPWLVESERDRTNLALMHAGEPEDEPIEFRITLESDDPGSPGTAEFETTLAPGEFVQYGRVLGALAPVRSGRARITRLSGDAPYLAYASVNDSTSADGSFVQAVEIERRLPADWLLPSVVQSARYVTELHVTNAGSRAASVEIVLVATGTVLREEIAPLSALHLPDLFAELRHRGLPGAPAAGAMLASPLLVRARGDGPVQVLAGARVSTGSGGRFYGVYEPCVRPEPFRASAVLSDLRQDQTTRTNLGIVALDDPVTFRVEIYDGRDGRLAGARDGMAVAPGELLQIDSVLQKLAPSVARGWARILPASGARFAGYSVVMDGPSPGIGSDDGSFMTAVPP